MGWGLPRGHPSLSPYVYTYARAPIASDAVHISQMACSAQGRYLQSTLFRHQYTPHLHPGNRGCSAPVLQDVMQCAHVCIHTLEGVQAVHHLHTMVTTTPHHYTPGVTSLPKWGDYACCLHPFLNPYTGVVTRVVRCVDALVCPLDTTCLPCLPSLIRPI